MSRRSLIAAFTISCVSGCPGAAPIAERAPPESTTPRLAPPTARLGRILDRSGRVLVDGSPSGRVLAPPSLAVWLGVDSPIGGLDRSSEVRLSFDRERHERLEAAFADVQLGAAVAIDVEKGGVLALFSKGESRGDRSIAERHVAVSSMLPPASAIKPFTALGAMALGVLTPETKHVCRGSFAYRGTQLRCWGAHGSLDVQRALVVSDNSFFYEVVSKLTLDQLADNQRSFGFGRAPDWPPGAAAGLVPDAKWYARRDGGSPEHHTLVQAIGHGDIRVTPLQLALGYAAIASGRRSSPTLTQESAGQSGEALPESYTANLPPVREALARAVSDASGTAHFGDLKPDVAGKMGSADEMVDGVARKIGWFAGWTPAEKPRIAFAFYAENLSGRAVARIALEPGLISSN